MSFCNGLPFCCIKSLPLLISWRTTGWTNFGKTPLIHKFQTRNATSFPKNTRRLNKKDNVPDDYNLIYHAPLNNYTIFSQCFGIFSAFSVSVCSFFYLYSGKQIEQLKVGSLDFITGIEDILAFNAISVCMTFAIVIVSRKCTLRIYHNPLKSDYIAIFPSVAPFKTVKVNFDKAARNSSVGFLFNNINYKLGTKKAFLLDHYFKCPVNLTEMLDETSKE